jgi:hypothetical protein
LDLNVSKQVSDLEVLFSSENKTETPAEKNFIRENVLTREEIKENLKKIQTSVHGIDSFNS